jgi:hypothetical protein
MLSVCNGKRMGSTEAFPGQRSSHVGALVADLHVTKTNAPKTTGQHILLGNIILARNDGVVHWFLDPRPRGK